MKRWQAVLFDLDDTLYPECEFVRSGMRAVAAGIEKELGLSCEKAYADLVKLFESGIRGEIFNRWLAGEGLNVETWLPKMIDFYRLHEPSIHPFPGVRDLLGQLQRECKLGLISDGYLEVQQRKWSVLRLQDFFQTVIFSDAWGRDAWKPSTRTYEEAIVRMKIPAEKMVYVADNPIKDFRGARALGIETIRIRHPASLHRRLEPATPADAPDKDIVDLNDLKTLMFEKW